MEKRIQLLDCTLRDGAYICNGDFKDSAIRGIINKCNEGNIDIIECGWLKNDEHKKGSSYFHMPDDLIPYLGEKNSKHTYVVMIDWDRYDVDKMPVNVGKSIDAVRVVFPYGKHKEGIEVGRKIMAKGYKVFFQAANTLAYSDDDLVALAKEVNNSEAVSLSIVDTFGAMYEEDLDRIAGVLDKELSPEIKLGFHSHNNQQLSFALSMHFVESLSKGNRGIVVDASLCGMGRGAGNATTELLANYLNRKQFCNYDMDAIMDAIDIYMEYFKANFSWGYSTPYFIAGMYCCHVNNIAYLLSNHRTNAKDMRNIIESLSPAERKKYDYDLLESKYIENQNRVIDDTKAIEDLKGIFDDREILLIAPGKSSLDKQNEIKEYIEKNNPIVVAVNALLSGYDYDYLFLTNSARYEYAKEKHPKGFAATKKILLSNITNAKSEDFVVNYSKAIKRGWPHFDNAVICALRLLDKLHVENVTLAGFDGFKTRYNESYAEKTIPAIYDIEDWDALNAEIKEMYSDVVSKANYLKNIKTLTESAFIR